MEMEIGLQGDPINYAGPYWDRGRPARNERAARTRGIVGLHFVKWAKTLNRPSCFSNSILSASGFRAPRSLRAGRPRSR